MNNLHPQTSKVLCCQNDYMQGSSCLIVKCFFSFALHFVTESADNSEKWLCHYPYNDLYLLTLFEKTGGEGILRSEADFCSVFILLKSPYFLRPSSVSCPSIYTWKNKRCWMCLHWLMQTEETFGRTRDLIITGRRPKVAHVREFSQTSPKFQ